MPDTFYTLILTSSSKKGEFKVVVNEDELTCENVSERVSIPYSKITAFALKDWILMITTVDDEFLLTKMGNLGEALLKELYEAYNKKVLKALFVDTAAMFETQCDVEYLEIESTYRGHARVQVHEDCVCVLTMDDEARRISLTFVVDLVKADYSVSLCLLTNEKYIFSKLGYDMDSFVKEIETNISKIRDKNVKKIREIDKSLSMEKAYEIAKMMPCGIVASFDKLIGVSKGFIEALESKLTSERQKESYRVFKEGYRDDLYIGCIPQEKTNEVTEAIGSKISLSLPDLGAVPNNAPGGILESPEESFWIIATGNNKIAALEFLVGDDDSAATYLYSYAGSYVDFLFKACHALEAIGFRRDVIRKTEKDLREIDDSLYLMALKRNKSLKYLREKFVGRIIHSSMDRWRDEITKALS